MLKHVDFLFRRPRHDCFGHNCQLAVKRTNIPGHLCSFISDACVAGSVLVGRRASFYVAVLGILAFDFFFVEPVFTFSVDDPQYYFGFAAFFLAALLIGRQTDLLRTEKNARRRWEESDITHYEFCRRIATPADLLRFADLLAARVSLVTGRRPEVWLAENSGQLKCVGASNSLRKDSGLNFLQVPLRTSDKVLGFLAVDITKSPPTYEELKLLEDLSNLVAVTVKHY
jgi:two-component system sensor histidine kinase KdpD